MTSIGRVGRGTLELRCIGRSDFNGDRLTLVGAIGHPDAAGREVNATELAEILAERQRINGYVNNQDEPIVPVIWDADATINGFYRVLGTRVTMEGPSLKSGIFPVTFELERVAGYTSPQFECTISGATITNPHGNNGEAWQAFPASVTEQNWSGGGGDSLYARESEDGVILFQTSQGFVEGVLSYYLTPENFYVGACRIHSGSPLELVVGRQIVRAPYDWRISNGLVRVSPATGVFRGGIDFQWWDPDTDNWSTVKHFRLAGSFPSNDAGTARAGYLLQVSNATIMRNSPEMCVIRMQCLSDFAQAGTIDPQYLALGWGRILVDVTVRQGDRCAELNLTSDRPDFWQIGIDTAEPATALTGGIRATNTDAEGNRWVMGTSAAKTDDLVNGKMTRTGSATSFFCWVGLEVGGAGAVGSAQAQRLLNQHFMGQVPYLTVAAR